MVIIGVATGGGGAAPWTFLFDGANMTVTPLLKNAALYSELI